MSSYHPRPVVIVTGANSGIGFGICHRFIVQLCRKQPPDSFPQPALVNKPGYLVASSSSSIPKSGAVENASDASVRSYDGLTLILACRSTARGDKARADLLRLLDAEVSRLRDEPAYDGHAEVFAKGVRIVVQRVDLAEVKSVFGFAEELKKEYPYVSHLICNAGVASLIGLDWLLCFKQLVTEPVVALTSPLYKLQRKGERSVDGLGYVWQCNVFGHYVMYRLLEPLLHQYWSKFKLEPRIIWMSSIEALPSCYNPDDWQLLNNDHSYEASKFQTDLMVGYFESQQQMQLVKSAANDDENTEVPRIRHVLVHPGVASTNIAAASLNWLLMFFMDLSFYFARMLGSQNHVITPFNGAIAAVHLSLVVLPLLTAHSRDEKQPAPLKFSSQATRLSKAYVGASVVRQWDERKADGVLAAQKCEELFLQFAEKHGGKR